MDMLKQTQELKQKKTIPPMFMMIPIEDKDIVASKKKLSTTRRTNVCPEEIQDSREGISLTNTRFKEKDNCHNLVILTKLKYKQNKTFQISHLNNFSNCINKNSISLSFVIYICTTCRKPFGMESHTQARGHTRIHKIQRISFNTMFMLFTELMVMVLLRTIHNHQ